MTVRLRPDREMLATRGTPVRFMPAVELSSSVRFSACALKFQYQVYIQCCAGCRCASAVQGQREGTGHSTL
jgi:hypothetical protein